MQVRKLKSTRDIQREAVERDSVITKLVNATPEQIDSWVENNVLSLDDVQALLKRMLKQLAVLSRGTNG